MFPNETETQRYVKQVLGYYDKEDAPYLVARAIDENASGRDNPMLICPISMAGVPRLCHNACVWCPADMTREGRE